MYNQGGAGGYNTGMPQQGGRGYNTGMPPQQQGGRGYNTGMPPQQQGGRGYNTGMPPQQQGGYNTGMPPQQQGGYNTGMPAQSQQYGTQQQQQNWYSAYGNVSPQERQKIVAWFQAVDTDKSGQVDVNELHRALGMGGHGFSLDVVHRLVQAFDIDNSGAIGLDEFIAMHSYLNAMNASFQYFDQDKSNTLDLRELHQALGRAGYQISQQALYAICPKFDPNRTAHITLPKYIDLCIWLGNMKKLMQFYDRYGRGSITINFDQLLSCTPYFQ